MLNILFSIVVNFEIVKVCTFDQLLEGLKGERMKKKIDDLRNLLFKGDPKAALLKRKLPAIMVSGEFTSRSKNGLIKYTKLVCLDLDKVEGMRLFRATNTIRKCPFTLLAFKSPSGKGLKVFVKVDTEAEHHTVAYKQVREYYEKLTGCEFDKTHDLVRLMYMSYDPKYHFNPDSQVFNVKPSEGVVSTGDKILLAEPPTQEYQAIYDHAIRIVEKDAGKYEEGNRNNFIFRLACVCNRYGLPRKVLDTMLGWCDLPDYEVTSALNNGYANEDEHCTYKLNANNVERRDVSKEVDASIAEAEKEDIWIDAEVVSTELMGTENRELFALPHRLEDEVVNGGTPYIPLLIKQRFPTLVSDLAALYSNRRESDIVFTTANTIISVIASEACSMVYRKELLYPAHASIIVARSGSGKSTVNHVRRIFEPLHEKLISGNKLKNGLFLADNFTLASFTKALAENNGLGAIVSSDAGFFLPMITKNPGLLQGIFRTTQSAEPLRNGRSIKKAVTNVLHPKLAISLSALPQEVGFLFSDPADGVNSRFLAYTFAPDGTWNNLEDESVEQYNQRVSHFSNQIINFYEFCKLNSFEFRFTEEQFDAFNTRFSDQYAISAQGSEADVLISIVVRMQTHVIKLAMVLATLRAWEHSYLHKQLSLAPDDFDAVMELGAVYMEHALAVAKLKPQTGGSAISPEQQKYYDALPDKFKLKDALEVSKANGFKISERTVSNYLKKFVNMRMLEHEYNSYVKRNSLGQTA